MTPHTTRRSLRLLLAVPAIALALGSAFAQSQRTSTAEAGSTATTYEPVIGQKGKDVVWVPTGEALVEQMLRAAQITPQDYVVDLGSGDGRTVIAAAKQGARAHGIEFNPKLVELARQTAKKAGVADRATFAEGDIFKSDFSNATVVTLFLLPELNLRLRPTLLNMKPGTRVISNSFDMGDWPPDESISGGPKCKSYCRAYKWVVPAKIEGTWELGNNATLQLDQTYQLLNGRLTMNGKSQELLDGRLLGTHIAFTAGDKQYTGEVTANQMTGRDNQGNAWTAKRKQ